MRKEFPFLMEEANKSLIYFDNASTTPKPLSVIEKMDEVYRNYPMNIHRGSYAIAEKASYEYENAREHIREFLNANHRKEILFTKGTTEAINLLSHSFGARYIKPGDEIVISHMEHHANIVPWKMLCDRTGAILKVIPITLDGQLDMAAYERLLTPKTKLVAIVYVSNSLGTVNPVSTIIKQAHLVGAKVLVDAAQAIGHLPIDVQALDCDFLCFSGHKMYGPFGVGVLYGKEQWLHEMPPFMGGGGMIQNVTFDTITYSDLPSKFEPGTPPVASVIGLGEAVRFLKRIGFDYIKDREEALASYAQKQLSTIAALKIFGSNVNRSPLFSFIIEGVHPHDVSTFLDQKGIAVRSGHHCNQPVIQFYKVPATSRISLAFYNTEEELDYTTEALKQASKFFI